MIFKKRYFSMNDFMDAQIGYQPYYALRSLMNARDVIDFGIRSCIWKNKKMSNLWLPKRSSFKFWSQIRNFKKWP